MNRLFVAYKPAGVGSNTFLSRLKRKYGVKKAGFSGTLDPFAKGVLVVGFGSHTKLFRFLNKTPKRYRATLWLGAHSPSLDSELIERIERLEPFEIDEVKSAVETLQGELEYTPPIFSAKHVDGRRAYDLAREGKEVHLQKVRATVYDAKLLHYRHPFVTFEVSVSEGTYVRSLGAIVAQRLGGCAGSLSALERLCEGAFVYENEQALDIKEYLALEQNYYNGDFENIKYGRVLALIDLEIKNEGSYWIDGGDFISVVTIENESVRYELGRIEIC
ncbi:MAG: tRNA pseudouridine(55) synthase TruB [Epsilonproteobacteria bacterium]|nr:tRNA pseudouridine(55) synthase TruB [Campylobacterota bacterium]